MKPQNYSPTLPSAIPLQATLTPNDGDVGIYVFDKKSTVTGGAWDYQFLGPQPSDAPFTLASETGFLPHPAVDVESTVTDAYLVTSRTRDPQTCLRVSTLRGLPPNVAWVSKVVPVSGYYLPQRISQPSVDERIETGDARVGSPPVLRATRVKQKGQASTSLLRLYTTYGVGGPPNVNGTLNGIRVDILKVADTKGDVGAGLPPVALEGSFQVFRTLTVRGHLASCSGLFCVPIWLHPISNWRAHRVFFHLVQRPRQASMTFPSIAVNKAGVIGLGNTFGSRLGMGVGLISVDSADGDVSCVPPMGGTQYGQEPYGTHVTHLGRWSTDVTNHLSR